MARVPSYAISSLYVTPLEPAFRGPAFAIPLAPRRRPRPDRFDLGQALIALASARGTRMPWRHTVDASVSALFSVPPASITANGGAPSTAQPSSKLRAERWLTPLTSAPASGFAPS